MLTLLKRARLSMMRHKIKYVFFSFSICILGGLLVTAMITRHAILRTEENLFSQLAPVATIDVGGNVTDLIKYITEHGYDPSERSVNPSVLREIGQLPYVVHFDISLRQRLWNEELNLFGRPDFMGGWAEIGVWPMPVIGIENHNVVDIMQGIIGLTEGRTFTSNEMTEGQLVAIVSQPFANLNGLSIGSTFELESRVFNEDYNLEPGFFTNRSYISASRMLQLEVIGIFEVLKQLEFEPALNNELQSWEEMQDTQMNNLIYIPLKLMESLPTFEPEGHRFRHSFDPFFVLHDPFDLFAFTIAANEILPPGWEVVEPSAYYRSVLTALETIHDLSALILTGSLIAVVVILFLQMLLMFKTRQLEIAIYLALGESKFKILFQLLWETMTLTLVGLLGALIIGRAVAGTLSRFLLTQELAAHLLEGGDFFSGRFTWYVQELTVDEVMINFAVSLTGRNILFIFSLFVAVAILASLVANVYLLHLNPKEILLNAKHG